MPFAARFTNAETLLEPTSNFLGRAWGVTDFGGVGAKAGTGNQLQLKSDWACLTHALRRRKKIAARSASQKAGKQRCSSEQQTGDGSDKGAAKVRLLTGAGLIDAAVVKVDAANDLALLKAVGRFAPLPIAASRTVKLGGTVATVGFPDIGLQGFAPKLAKGEIASLAGAADDPRYFQISLPVQPGNSGGALVDARGNVVGIVAAKLDASAALAATGSLPENVNYAVKSSLLLSFLESVPDVAGKTERAKHQG